MNKKLFFVPVLFSLLMTSCSKEAEVTVTVSGKVENSYKETSPITVTLDGGASVGKSTIADANGNYTFTNVPIGYDYTIGVAQKDSDPKISASTFDLVLLGKQISSGQTTNDSFVLVAMDLDNSGSIDNEDTEIFRSLLLIGSSSKIPDYGFYRFIPNGFDFKTSTNAKVNSFEVKKLNADINIPTFKAVKIGDFK